MSSSTSSSTAPQAQRAASARKAARASSSPPASSRSATHATRQAGTQTAGTQPAGTTQRHVAEARAALVASMGNMLDAELQGRAAMLHEGAAALSRQERDVASATQALRRERERLAREADAATRRVKELGNVQNWAEVLERGFLVLEETVRLANGGGSSSSSSCSACAEDEDEDEDEGGAMHVDDDDDGDAGVAEPKAGEAEQDAGVAVAPEGPRCAWSDASRSLMEPESSMGTGRAKGSETASMSTASLRDGDGDARQPPGPWRAPPQDAG